MSSSKPLSSWLSFSLLLYLEAQIILSLPHTLLAINDELLDEYKAFFLRPNEGTATSLVLLCLIQPFFMGSERLLQFVEGIASSKLCQLL